MSSTMKLLTDEALERSAVVANCRMNRERDLVGSNGYDKELGFNPLDFLKEALASIRPGAWLDLCCGTGKALIQAAEHHAEGRVPGSRSWASIWSGCSKGSIPISPACDWSRRRFVRGGPIDPRPGHLRPRAALRRRQAGADRSCRLLAHPGGAIRGEPGPWQPEARRWPAVGEEVVTDLVVAGLEYDRRRRPVTCRGRRTMNLPYRYLGADDRAGPNYTGQPAVDSLYEADPPG